jgi:hypothetical protein
MPLQKRALMCINDPGVTELWTLILEKEFAQQYELSVTETSHVGKLLTLAQTATADLFILLLNNMLYSDIPHLHKLNRVDSALATIAHLKQTYHRPVIAMTGWPISAENWNANNTKQAGVDFLFQIPIDVRRLKHAAKQCLEQGEAAFQDDGPC